MLPENRIALSIYGGVKLLGFDNKAMVEVGSVPAEFKPNAPLLVTEIKVWMIIHAQEYTAYQIYTTDCPARNNIPTHLLISLFIPSEQRLAGGESPASLLQTILDLFSVQAFVNESWPEGVDGAFYETLLRRYQLEARNLLLPIMEGGTPATFCINDMSQVSALMRHSRYPALSKVGRLEIGTTCSSTVNLPINGSPLNTESNSSKSKSKSESGVKSQKKKINFLTVGIYAIAGILLGIIIFIGYNELRSVERAVQERESAIRKAELDRIAAEKVKQERMAAEQAEQERLAAEKAEQERLAAEKAEKDRKAAAEKAKNDSFNKASLLTEITIFLKEKQGTQSEQESSAMITKAKGHKGWSTLSNEEKLAASVVIEGINHSQVKTLKKTQKQKVVNVVKNGFSTWEDLVEGRNQIVKIINEK